MRDDEYRAMFDLEDHLWWYEGMRAVTTSILTPYISEKPLRILDVGCGTGYSLSWLRRTFDTQNVFGLDVSPNASVFWREHHLNTAAIASASQIPFASNTFDLVTCFDVVYQLAAAEASAVISEVRRVLTPGGLLFIREPAYDWMRAGHDVAVGTHHRYTLGELKRLLVEQGFSVKRATYANTLLFGPAVGHRLVSKVKGDSESDVKPVARSINSALAAVLKVEARMLAGISFPFGLSAIAVARKNQS
jgi:ubiquinone/menaquinone biosynthesis C-methylase UbiE